MGYNFKGYKISGELLDHLIGRLSGSGFLGFADSERDNTVISLASDLAEAKGVEIEHVGTNKGQVLSSIPDWDCWWWNTFSSE